MEDLIKLAIEGNWSELFDRLENESPHVFDKVIHNFIINHNNGEFDSKTLFTPEQYEKYRWLGSSKRRIEYYNKIPDEEMTADDWFDLKASAW